VKPLDLTLLWACQDNGSVHGIRYTWNAKPDVNPPIPPTDAIAESDCSGWWRYLMARQGITVPEGSQEQMAWCKAQGLPETSDYGAVGAAKEGEVFACFALDTRATGGHAGHVWNCENGETMECHGGAGVDSRPWNTGVLRRIFHVAYRLPVA
jgi:cell wall-associated NlpC family hydrolase